MRLRRQRIPSIAQSGSARPGHGDDGMRRWLLAGAGSAAATLAAFGVLLLFRYQPMATESDSVFLHVWDRLGRRECVTTRPMTTNVTGMACNRREIEELQAQIDRAEQVAERQASDAAAAAAYKSALAIAGGDSALAKDVGRYRQAGFSDAEISDHVAVERIAKVDPDMAARIARCRAAGCSDAAILTSIQSHRRRAAGS